MSNTQHLQDFSTQVRRDILRMVHAVNSGHPGGSLGCTEFFTVLYQQLMDRKPGFNMDGIGEDLFFLSNGHISPVFYSVLPTNMDPFAVRSLKECHCCDTSKISTLSMRNNSIASSQYKMMSCAFHNAVVRLLNEFFVYRQ